MAFSLLLILRRLSSHNPSLQKTTFSLFLSHHPFTPKPKPFSSLSSLDTTTASDHPKPSSLSSRMSFVFDQIDAIEKERFQKDETLQRIRAWRDSKKNKTNEDTNNTALGLGLGSIDSNSNDAKLDDSNSGEMGVKKEREGLVNKAVDLVHPWPEWIELMERLVQQNYFDHRRKDEDKMVEDLGFSMSEVAEEVFDFTRDWKTVQTACLNFGRDRFDILRSLSRQDIQVLVGYGCPSADKKVVFSAKLLRKHVHLDEGDVCSSCSLRSSCERAYLLTNKEDEARTLDIMRALLTYGFDPVNGSVVNESLLKIKSVKTVVRKLLHAVVKLSAVPIDPNLPPPVIKKPPPKVKQPPPPPKKRVGRDDIEMKKGDWLCPKCDFMNFAKNTVCLQCDAHRPKRQLLPGEWECPECNFLNYRRNMVCFHCEHKRPPDEFTENQMQERQRGPRTRLEKLSSRTEVSNAWNFDFDDNESDGADVAAFEYADSHKLDEDFPLGRRAEVEKIRGAENDFYKNSRSSRSHEREYNNPGPKQRGMGFDDFDDEEDDVESYELDTQNSNQVQKTSSIDFSELEVDSESEDAEGTHDNWHAHRRTSSPRNNRASKPMSEKSAFSGSEDDKLDIDSDEGLLVHPKWKSSHVANSRPRPRSKGAISFGSDEEPGLSSGTENVVDEDFRSRQNKGNKWSSSRRDFGRRGSKNVEYEPFSGSESDDEDLHFRRDRLRGNKIGPGRRRSESDDEDLHFRRDRLRGNKAGPATRRNNSKGRGGFDNSEDSRLRSHGVVGDRRNPLMDKFDRSSRVRGSDRGFREADYGGRRTNTREGDSRNFRSPKRENFGNQHNARSNNFDNRSATDSYFDDERHRRQRDIVR